MSFVATSLEDRAQDHEKLASSCSYGHNNFGPKTPDTYRTIMLRYVSAHTVHQRQWECDFEG